MKTFIVSQALFGKVKDGSSRAKMVADARNAIAEAMVSDSDAPLPAKLGLACAAVAQA
jgi:hypothetical protein